MPPKGDSTTQNGRFRVKLHLAWRKSATQFLCVKTVSDKVVRHLLTHLFV